MEPAKRGCFCVRSVTDKQPGSEGVPRREPDADALREYARCFSTGENPRLQITVAVSDNS